MKKTFSVLLTVAVVLGLSLVSAVPVAAVSQTLLSSTGEIGTGNEDRMVVPVDLGTTLGDIESIAWSEYLLQGYPPHVDIILNLGGGATDALVFEYAYNNDTHYLTEPPMPYGAILGSVGGWAQVFNDDGNGPSEITGTSFAWLSSGASGPYPNGAGFVGGTLADWKAGGITGGLGINSDTPVLRLEIEVDNWLVDTEAWVKDILVNGSPAGNTAVGLTTDVPDIVAINVDPTIIDFGTLLPGQTSAVFDITVANIGTHAVDVDADVYEAGLFYNNLELRDYTLTWSKRDWPLVANDLAMGASQLLKTKLTVPTGYTPKDVESATLIFKAKPMV